MTDVTIFGALFDHHKDVQPYPFEMDWASFTAVLQDIHVREDKFSTESAPGYSLAHFKTIDGRSARQNVYVDCLSGIVIDFDAGFDIDDVLERLSGIALAAHTTWKHDPSAPRWRVIVPLASAVPGPKYKSARAWLMNRLGGNTPDKQAVALSNFYYLPCCAPGREDLYELRVVDGPFLELPAMSEFQRGLPPPRIVGSKIDWDWLKAKMRSHKDEHLRAAFKRVLRAEPYAGHGERDNTLLRMCGALAGWAPGCDPDDLAEIFRPSIDKMFERDDPSDPPPDVDNAADKIARSQASLLADARQENPEAAAQAQEIPVAEAAADDLVEAWALQVGLPNGDELRRRLLLRKGASLWMWRTDLATWAGPMTESEVQGAARLDLGAMAGVNVWVRKVDGGLRLRTLPEIFHDYGQTMDSIAADLRITRDQYDATRRRLITVGAPRRPLESLYDPVVDEWLRALGGDKAEKLLDWIAGLTWLERPNSVLFLKGDPGVGKGLLLRGLSRVWETDNPVDMQRVAAAFNDDLRRCPLVQISEGKWNRFVDVTTMLRDMVTQPSRTVNRKYHEPIELMGYLRFVVTANNFNIFANDQHSLTTQDRDAIAQRFLEVDPSPRALDLLASLDPVERDSLASQDRIAMHALWLGENHKVDSPGRFVVEGERDGRFAMRIITEDHKWGSWVMEWLARYLTEPLTVEREYGGLVHRADGSVIVSPEAVVNTFERVLKNKRPPQSLDISNVLCSLSTGKLVSLPGDRASGFEVLVEEIAWWAQEKGVGNAASIRANAAASKAARAPASKVVQMRGGSHDRG